MSGYKAQVIISLFWGLKGLIYWYQVHMTLVTQRPLQARDVAGSPFNIYYEIMLIHTERANAGKLLKHTAENKIWAKNRKYNM